MRIALYEGAESATTHAPCAFCGAWVTAVELLQPQARCQTCESPLAPAPQEPSSGESRRAFHRMDRNLVVTCRRPGSTTTFEALTLDASVGGVRLTSTRPLEIDHVIRIECEFYEAVGVIRHVGLDLATERFRPRWRAGVRFITLLVKRPRGTFVWTVA